MRYRTCFYHGFRRLYASHAWSYSISLSISLATNNLVCTSQRKKEATTHSPYKDVYLFSLYYNPKIKQKSKTKKLKFLNRRREKSRIKEGIMKKYRKQAELYAGYVYETANTNENKYIYLANKI